MSAFQRWTARLSGRPLTAPSTPHPGLNWHALAHRAGERFLEPEQVTQSRLLQLFREAFYDVEPEGTDGLVIRPIRGFNVVLEIDADREALSFQAFWRLQPSAHEPQLLAQLNTANARMLMVRFSVTQGDGPTRFNEAVLAILWHELAIVAMALLIVALTWGQPNQVATWTFALLWVMRLSAKFNLFLGVRNRGEEFLPPHLLYLGSYFRQRSINALLPLSLLAGSTVAVALALLAAGTDGAQRVGLVLVTAMLVLALIEHLLMVLPLRTAFLWRWALRQGQAFTS